MQLDTWYIFLLYTLMVPYISLVIIINIKKFLTRGSRPKWAFFHPFCNDGGGGQKVLWCMIKALAEQTDNQIAIYSLEPSKQKIMQKIQERFVIHIDKQRFKIIHVNGRELLTSKRFLTMVLHIILPMIYALKCLWKYQPDYFYDTTGYASTLPLTKILLPTCKTVAYVHYPFISKQMIQKVKDNKADFNNSQTISKSPLLSKAKIIYYQLIFFVYKNMGWFVDFAQTNSSWTYEHMKEIWSKLDKSSKLIKLYPPCTVNKLIKAQKPNPEKQLTILSLAQFRPEKRQQLQLQIFAQLLKNGNQRRLKLRMCGTTRGSQDQAILQRLQQKAKQLKIQDQVQFVINQPFTKILESLKNSWIGIHTMEAEHFGISVVEMLAAGVLVVAHSSAGPKQDIIKDDIFLATDKQDYIRKLQNIIQLNKEELQILSQEGRTKSTSFSQSEFEKHFIQSLQPVKSK